MPTYQVQISKKAEKQLDKLSDAIADLILAAIEKLADNPRPQGYIKLKQRDGYRIRVGNYRVIYEIFDKNLIVDVIAVGDRKDVYH